jgi:HK97 family phage major capsid protein
MNLAKKVLETRALQTQLNEREMVEQRNNLLEELETIVDLAKVERRSLSGKEQNRFNAIKAEISSLDLQMQSKQLGFDNLQPIKGTSVETRAKLEEETRALMDYIVKQDMRSLTASASGNAVIPTQISKMIVDKIVQMSPILQRANIINTNADISIPVFDFTTIQAAYIIEGNEISEQSQNYEQLKLTNHIIAALVRCSRSLVNRSDFNVLEFLVNAMAKNLGWFLERQLILGTGTNQLRGLTTLPSAQQVTGATTLTTTAEELIDLSLRLPQFYQERAIWVTNPETLSDIYKLKASGSGEFLFANGSMGNGMGMSLLGKPVYVSDAVPVNAPGANYIYYLDPSALTVKMTQDIGIQILDQTYASTYNYGILGFVECDSAITETQGVVSLVGA